MDTIWKSDKTHKKTSLIREHKGQPLPSGRPQGCKEHQDSIAKVKEKQIALPWNGQ